MSNQELFMQAQQAAIDYLAVYGLYPDKIGIHHARFHFFPYTHLVIPIYAPLAGYSLLTSEIMPIRAHRVNFQAILGATLQEDEVYLPIPGNDARVISGEALARKKAERSAC